jgi:hypothetical protein
MSAAAAPGTADSPAAAAAGADSAAPAAASAPASTSGPAAAATTLIRGTTHNDETGEEEEVRNTRSHTAGMLSWDCAQKLTMCSLCAVPWLQFTIETLPLSALSSTDTDKLQSLALKVLKYFDSEASEGASADAAAASGDNKEKDASSSQSPPQQQQE